MHFKMTILSKSIITNNTCNWKFVYFKMTILFKCIKPFWVNLLAQISHVNENLCIFRWPFLVNVLSPILHVNDNFCIFRWPFSVNVLAQISHVYGHIMLKFLFTYDICANTFIKNDHLKMHKLLFTCDICAFTNSHLIMHKFAFTYKYLC